MSRDPEAREGVNMPPSPSNPDLEMLAGEHVTEEGEAPAIY